MSLNGVPLVVLLALLTVGLPVATVLLWSRLGRGRLPAGAVRGSMVAASQLVAVLLVGVLLNDYAYFYSSWGEVWSSAQQLFGPGYTTTPATYSSGKAGPAPVSSGIADLTTLPTYASPRSWAKRGRLQAMTIDGGISQLHTHAYVYLPPQYFQAKYAHTRFPALEVYSGYPSSDKSLITRYDYQGVLRGLLRQARVRPMVLVMMRPTITFPHDTECTDVPGGPQTETFYSQDVPSVVSARFRVKPLDWGAMGSSTGGYCAAKVTMLNPRTFHAAAAMSGYYTALHDYTTGNLWGGSPVVKHLNNLEWRLRHLPAPPVSILALTSLGENGPYGHLDTLRFAHLARPPMRVSVIMRASGSHTFSTWGPEMPEALIWLSAKLYHLPAPTGAQLQTHQAPLQHPHRLTHRGRAHGQHHHRGALTGTAARPAPAARPRAAVSRSAGVPGRSGGRRRRPRGV